MRKDMIEKIREYSARYGMLKQSDRVIAGISGGADSVCLFYVLLKLREEIGFSMAVVHVNHGLRGSESDEDEEFVKKLCETFSVPFQSYYYDVESESRKRKQSIEESGREVRRGAFQRAAAQYGGTKTALAHHQDDNAETVILNLSRGSRLSGLGGIRPVSGQIIRPLLCVRRAEIEEWLEEKGIDWRTDRTNLEDHYVRNRIRMHVVPYLEQKVNAMTVPHINEMAVYLCQVQEYLDKQAEEAVKTAVKDGVILEEEFRKLPDVVSGRMIYRYLASVSGQARDLEEAHVRMVRELFEKQTGRSVDLPYGVRAVRKYEGVCIEKKNGPGQYRENDVYQKEYPLYPGTTVRAGKLSITAKLIEKGAESGGKPPENIYTKWLDYGIIKGTVMVRTRRPGDYLTIDRDGNRQKLKVFFINEKIPKEKRDQIWLIACGSEILWVIGYRLGHKARITDRTKTVLEIKADGGEKDVRDNQSVIFRGTGG